VAKKRLRFSFVLWAFVFIGGAAGEDLLKVETSVTPLRLSRGEEGKVVLKISVKPGITISPLPSFIVEFDPNAELVFPKDFFTAADLKIATAEIAGRERLSLKKPVEVPFTVNPKAGRGVHTVTGRIRYFGISEAGGWCLKSATKFSATYSTRLTTVEKKRPEARPSQRP
jgi:hypothetical protein